MAIRTLLAIFITCNALSTYNCFNMELQIQDNTITPLNNGLLTIVSGTITKTGYKYDSRGSEKKIEKTFNKTDTLTNLLHCTACTHDDSRYTQAYFTPIIIKLTIKQPNSYIEYLGEFNKFNAHRHEAKAAIVQNKALFWAHQKGFLIYSIDQQPDPSICEHISRMLKTKKLKMEMSR
jgi:hypothetical protein